MWTFFSVSWKSLEVLEIFGGLGNLWRSWKSWEVLETFGGLGNLWKSWKSLEVLEIFGGLLPENNKLQTIAPNTNNEIEI